MAGGGQAEQWEPAVPVPKTEVNNHIQVPKVEGSDRKSKHGRQQACFIENGDE
jgi:hypothetical protein